MVYIFNQVFATEFLVSALNTIKTSLCEDFSGQQHLDGLR